MSDERKTVRVIGFEDAEIIKEWVASVGVEITRLSTALAAAERERDVAIKLANIVKGVLDHAEQECASQEASLVGLRGALEKKRTQIREYIAGIDPTSGEHRRHALTIAESRLLQINMDIAEVEALSNTPAQGSALLNVAKAMAGALNIAREVIYGPRNAKGMLADMAQVRQQGLDEIDKALSQYRVLTTKKEAGG